MNKKIITIIVAGTLAFSLFGPMAFASEVTGTLSSGGVLSETDTNNGQNTNGTLSGSVVGGTAATTTTTSGTTTSSGGGNFLSGGSSTVPSGTITVSGSDNGATSDSVIAASPAGSVEGTSVGVTPVSTNDSGISVPATDQIAQAGPAGATDSAALGIPLAAQAGGAVPIGTKLAWTLFIILLLILAGYGIYRMQQSRKNTSKNPNSTLKP